jgi:hypothetical protein
MQNRKFEPYVATMNKILIPLMAWTGKDLEPCSSRCWLWQLSETTCLVSEGGSKPCRLIRQGADKPVFDMLNWGTAFLHYDTAFLLSFLQQAEAEAEARKEEEEDGDGHEEL